MNWSEYEEVNYIMEKLLDGHKQAARWAIDFLPEYSDVIRSALIWRNERNSSCRNPYETYVLAEKFVNDILERFFGFEERKL